MAITLQPVEPDYEGFLKTIRREGTPERVYYFEHGIAAEVQDAVAGQHGLWDHISSDSPQAAWDRAAEVYRFLGHELFRVFPPGARLESPRLNQAWVNADTARIDTRKDLEQLDWPSASDADLSVLEYYEKKLPENMKVFHVLDIWEVVRDTMGFENVCVKLYDDPGLVSEMFNAVGGFVCSVAEACCDFDCFGAVYLSDDLGYKTSLMISPDTVREYVMPWHKRVAEIAHRKNKLLFFHSCGQMYEMIDDYIDEVGIDAKHSFEEAVLPVIEAKRIYGDRLSLLGGMDVDFLARSSPSEIRQKTREILSVCQPGGGYCLGSGNWVTDYIPPENYLAMLDEARTVG